jgi:hypothetical protein
VPQTRQTPSGILTHRLESWTFCLDPNLFPLLLRSNQPIFIHPRSFSSLPTTTSTTIIATDRRSFSVVRRIRNLFITVGGILFKGIGAGGSLPGTFALSITKKGSAYCLFFPFNTRFFCAPTASAVFAVYPHFNPFPATIRHLRVNIFPIQSRHFAISISFVLSPSGVPLGGIA